MKKISMKEFKSMLESDKDFVIRLNDYLNGEIEEDIVGEKSIEFLRQEGYELDVSSIGEVLDDQELEKVAGGFKIDALGLDGSKGKIMRPVGKVVGRFLAALPGLIMK